MTLKRGRKKGHSVSQETRKKMSSVHKGKHLSPKTEFKKGHKGYWNEERKKKQRGKNAPMWGKKHSEKTKKHWSKIRKGWQPSEETKKKMGERWKGNKNPNWNNGSSFEPYSIDWTETLRRSIRERDHYICQLCSQYGKTVHHIDYDKKNCDPDNLITLCNSCNIKVNHNREYWLKHLYSK